MQTYLKRCQLHVEKALKRTLPPVTLAPRELHQAMHYAALAGGKRIRAALVYATGEALGASRSMLDPLAAAIEMIHTYSLIHDDLPALDNDALRRGKPTCHIKFGEATAILAGDALHTLAFELIVKLNSKKVSAAQQVEMLRVLTESIGSRGMIGGEAMDVLMVNKRVTKLQVETMFALKTGCLLTASLLLGAIVSGCKSRKVLNNLRKAGVCIGLAFQIHDDIIGMESDTKTLGKQQGADIAMNKPAYPLLVGMKVAKAREQALYQDALRYLARTGMQTENIEKILTYVIARKH